MKKFLLIGCGGLFSVFALLIIIGLIGAFTSSDDKKATTSKDETIETSEESKSSETANEKESIVRIGQELAVNKVSFTVNSIGETNKITAGNGMFTYKPDAEGAVFLNVNVTVKNNGTEMIQTDSSFFKLKTKEGVTYSPSTVVVSDDKYFSYEGINPGLALTGNVLFEVPAGLTDLDLHVQTGFWGTETGVIKLN